jgi:hypothetical protein
LDGGGVMWVARIARNGEKYFLRFVELFAAMHFVAEITIFVIAPRISRRAELVLESERFGEAIAQRCAMFGLALRVVEERIVERFAVVQDQAVAAGVALE